ncbi:hypothetical protein V8B97DRAFT_1932461 [Scleroderma yunnanense]
MMTTLKRWQCWWTVPAFCYIRGTYLSNVIMVILTNSLVYMPVVLGSSRRKLMRVQHKLNRWVILMPELDTKAVRVVQVRAGNERSGTTLIARCKACEGDD